MGLFRKARTTTLVPGSVAARLEDFGQFEFDPQGSPFDGGEIYHSIVAPVAAAARANPSGVVRELAAIARPVGGWAVYGAHRLVGELVGYECRDEDYLGMLDDALDFVRAQGYPSAYLNRYEFDRWLETHGPDTW